ncbi:molybdopterin biosynthesis protein [Desulfatibacillum aliphaticivorans]|uniref:molybdopterin biosynthesis protein n=1 Tax=Desulfatibacillum aliphaticivorans TaxID=218208 RepID=UPI000419FBCF|nr:molybdopterin biosynthesis protein [Desulfatibacillum aliphaticivorans]
MNKRHVYLNMKTREEARNIWLSHFAEKVELAHETISSVDAVGRVLAEPAFARISTPNAHLAAMDGIAVLAQDTFDASETNPMDLKVGEQAFYVNTGHQLPPQTNAVIMIEQVQVIDDDTVRIEAAAVPWNYVRKVGEDIVATEMLFPTNHLVTPTCLGALLTGGVFEVKVKKQPKVLVIPTGTELVDWRKIYPEELQPGRVLETNSWVIGKLIEQTGGKWIRNTSLDDDFFVIRQAVERGATEDYDMVLVLAGSSAGSEDHTANIVDNLGDVLVHGVTIMPGKPVVLGDVNNVPVVGVPGYPVSAIVVFDEFIRPMLCHMLGQPEPLRKKIMVEPTRKIPSKLGLEEMVRVKLGRVGDRVAATPLPRGAGSITSFTEADGIIRIPNENEGLHPGQPVEAELLRFNRTIDNTLVAVGSHDNTLDLLADALRSRGGYLSLSSSHVGSMGGLLAMKKGMCHIAGSHLLDTETGEYNISYIKTYLAGIPVKLVHLVMREQGLMVAKGNPKNIQSVEDLGRNGVRFINRQAGSGTRVLLDHYLSKLGIKPSKINGYGDDEFTHMAVAAAVQNQVADAGMGIYAAAKALELDFVPVITEQYDLIIPEGIFESEKIAILLETIRSDAFKKRVDALGGYHTERTGEVLM